AAGSDRAGARPGRRAEARDRPPDPVQVPDLAAREARAVAEPHAGECGRWRLAVPAGAARHGRAHAIRDRHQRARHRGAVTAGMRIDADAITGAALLTWILGPVRTGIRPHRVRARVDAPATARPARAASAPAPAGTARSPGTTRARHPARAAHAAGSSSTPGSTRAPGSPAAARAAHRPGCGIERARSGERQS